MTVELIIFDMDGVIFEGRNFWLDLHRRYSTEDEALDLAAHYLKDDYETLARFTAGTMWKGRSAAPFVELVRDRAYQDGVADLFDDLRRRRIKTAIVSSGPLQLAARAQGDLGIDEIRANELGIVDGCISGEVDVAVIDSEKGRVSLDVMASLGMAREQTAAVGDTESDIGVASTVGLMVAYDSVSPELDQVAHARLRKGELRRLTEAIDARGRDEAHDG